MSKISLVPPPSKELEAIVGRDIFNKINQIHSSTDTPKVKLQKVDGIFASLSDDVLRKIPIPKHLMGLPEDAKKEVHSIMIDKKLTAIEKYEKTKKVIRSQPPEIQAKCAPPLPSGFEFIPDDVKGQFMSLLMNDDLNFIEKLEKMHQLINSLPEDIKAKLGPPKS
uniref:STI1 domain-containing protein n=1 Tax=Strongyloides venezuelensis TaxID=75913 RepID=A0A0K0FIS5_STRVS